MIVTLWQVYATLRVPIPYSYNPPTMSTLHFPQNSHTDNHHNDIRRTFYNHLDHYSHQQKPHWTGTVIAEKTLSPLCRHCATLFFSAGQRPQFTLIYAN